MYLRSVLHHRSRGVPEPPMGLNNNTEFQQRNQSTLVQARDIQSWQHCWSCELKQFILGLVFIPTFHPLLSTTIVSPGFSASSTWLYVRASITVLNFNSAPSGTVQSTEVAREGESIYEGFDFEGDPHRLLLMTHLMRTVFQSSMRTIVVQFAQTKMCVGGQDEHLFVSSNRVRHRQKVRIQVSV